MSRLPFNKYLLDEFISPIHTNHSRATLTINYNLEKETETTDLYSLICAYNLTVYVIVWFYHIGMLMPNTPTHTEPIQRIHRARYQIATTIFVRQIIQKRRTIWETTTTIY